MDPKTTEIEKDAKFLTIHEKIEQVSEDATF